MTGKKETALESIFKPVRLGPVGSLGALTSCGISYCLFKFMESPFTIPATVAGSALIIPFLGTYRDSFRYYSRYVNYLTKNGWNEEWASRKMPFYVTRQALYVAAIGAGYRNEVNSTIKNTPKEAKRLSFLPHF